VNFEALLAAGLALSASFVRDSFVSSRLRIFSSVQQPEVSLNPHFRFQQLMPTFLRATLRAFRPTTRELHSSAVEGESINSKGPCTGASELSGESRHGQAVQTIDETLSANPADLDALSTKAMALASAGRLLEAKAAAVEWLSLDPQNLGALETLAHVENVLGEHERSLSLFRALASHKGLDENLARMIEAQERALERKRLNDTYARANELSSKHRYDEAVQILDQVLSAVPADLNALLTKGGILASAGRLREASAIIAKALALDPENLSGLETLAYVESALGEHEHSLSLFRQVASRRGVDDNLARMIENEKRAVEQKQLRDAYARATELSNKQRFDEALQIVERVIASRPADPNALVTKGAILTSAGRLPDARATLLGALAVDPRNVGALEALAYVESALGDHEHSLSLFRRLASYKGLDEALARLIGNEMWALDDKRRDSSTFKDFEEGCPPIEQVISDIDERSARGDPEDQTLQLEIIERLSRQIAAQTGVLSRLDGTQNFYDYTLTQERFRIMALHSYLGTPFKTPEDPPLEIPEAMRSAFSMEGRVELSQAYVNSALPPECSEGIDDHAAKTFLALNYAQLPASAKAEAAHIINGFAATQHPQTTKIFGRGSPNSLFGKILGSTPIPALDLRDKSVAVVASPDYYSDAILVSQCREVTSVRLRKDGGSTTLSKGAVLFDWLREEDSQYDVIICSSLLESWGLGRHGEPLDPDADIALMQQFRKKLQPTGTCCVQLPIGRDRLIFNAMRIYGIHRLSAILQGWRSAEAVKPDWLAARVPVRENFLLQPN